MLSGMFIAAMWLALLALVGVVYCFFVTFQNGILGQVWYLIVEFPDHCRLSYFLIIYKKLFMQKEQFLLI